MQRREFLKTFDVTYAPVEGIGEQSGVMRRDPSDIIRAGDCYFVWYTRGLREHGYDASIWYAVSPDGRTWTECGEALPRGEKGSWDEASVFTPSILAAEGRYYLFFTAVAAPFVRETSRTAIGVAIGESPHGPWRKQPGPVLVTSDDAAQFDSMRVDDACMLKRDGRYWLYFKGRQLGHTWAETRMGVAVSERPEGPYAKSPANPVVNGGHEVLVWPMGSGVMALISIGPEGIAKTLQYAADGVHFVPCGTARQVPWAAGAWRPEAFTDSGRGAMIEWGLHIGRKPGSLPFLERFDVLPARIEAPPDPLAWWREARFGMFIHWGLYCIPAGIWKGEEMPGIGEWLMAHFRVTLAEYRELARQFNPVAFDADAIAGLARDAGMRYLVITAKHHEGFAMWDSQASGYSIVRATPFGRDPLKELAAACQRAGIRFCLYYSQDVDWEHPDGGFNDWAHPGHTRDFGRYLEEKVKPQLRELLTQYGPIGLIWCDTPCTITAEQSADLKAFIHALQPDCLVSGRVGHGLGDYASMGDNQMPLGPVRGDWETPVTLNDTWGFKVGDHNWKSTATLIRLLADLAAKGVNLLLNIGPDAMGRVPAPSVERLRDVGAWMRINGEAIRGTSASPFAHEFPWGSITRRDNRLHLIFHQPPGGDFTLYGLRNRLLAARLLDRDRGVDFRQDPDAQAGFYHTVLAFGDRVAPSLPGLPVVVTLTLDGPPDIVPGIWQQPDGSVSLFAHQGDVRIDRRAPADRETAAAPTESAAAQAEGADQTGASQRLHIDRSGLLMNWQHASDTVIWRFRVLRPTAFRIRVHTVAPKHRPWVGGHRMRVEAGGELRVREIAADGICESPRSRLFAERFTDFGALALAAGEHTLRLVAEQINPAVTQGICSSGVFLHDSQLGLAIGHQT